MKSISTVHQESRVSQKSMIEIVVPDLSLKVSTLAVPILRSLLLQQFGVMGSSVWRQSGKKTFQTKLIETHPGYSIRKTIILISRETLLNSPQKNCHIEKYYWRLIVFNNWLFLQFYPKLILSELSWYTPLLKGREIEIKAELQQTFSACVYCMLLRFQCNYLDWLKPR